MRRRVAGPPAAPENCKEVTGLIGDYLNDRLTPAIRREFTRHLRICPDCVNFVKTYQKTITATQSVPIEGIPSGVRKNVLDFLRKKLHRAGALLLAATPIVAYVIARYF